MYILETMIPMCTYLAIYGVVNFAFFYQCWPNDFSITTICICHSLNALHLSLSQFNFKLSCTNNGYIKIPSLYIQFLCQFIINNTTIVVVIKESFDGMSSKACVYRHKNSFGYNLVLAYEIPHKRQFCQTNSSVFISYQRGRHVGLTDYTCN